MSLLDQDNSEDQRLLIATAVIATAVALYALPANSTDFLNLLRGFTVAPALLGFLFILGTGSHLKYKNAGRVGELNFAPSLRRSTYNWMIDMFWAQLLAVVLLIASTYAGWDGKSITDPGLWLGALISFMILGILIVASYYPNVIGLLKKVRRK